jgi:hypothetical protein
MGLALAAAQAVAASPSLYTTPPLLSSALLYLDARWGVTGSASAVLQWSDLSGNGNNAPWKVANASAQPTFANGSVPSLGFAFLNQALHHPVIISQPFSIFAIITGMTWQGTNYQTIIGTASGSMIATTNSGASWGSFLTTAGGSSAGKNVGDGKIHSLLWTSPTVGGTQTYYTDGTATTAAGGSAYSGANRQIGSGSNTGSGQGLNGSIVALMVWASALSAGNAASLHAWAQGQFGAP